MNIDISILKKLPKTDLHVHLDGSLRLTTLIELAENAGVDLPGKTPEALKETVFKPSYSNLVEYLQGFQYTVAAMQTEESLDRVAYELAIDNLEEGVRYIEVRFAPQLHINDQLKIEDVLKAVNSGLNRAKREYNTQENIKNGKEPGFEYGIIVCALRYFPKGLSTYYDQMLSVHRHSSEKRIFALTSLELAQAATAVRDKYGIPITGFDLAGAESGYPADDHIEAYSFAHKNFLKKTVHAGEAYGPESIFQAITALHADRIGHGTFIFNHSMINNPTIVDKEKYVAQLAQYIADRRITIEVNLTSNMQTTPMFKSFADHPFKQMKKARLSTTFCTDNRLVSDTTVTNEIDLAQKHLGLNPQDLKRSIIYGFKRSFFPGSYLEKRKYVRSVIDYYETIEKAHPELSTTP